MHSSLSCLSVTPGFDTQQLCSQMSQSRSPTDSQALLQSMLQKLKLQSGREGQAYLHTPVPVTAASTWGQDGEKGAFSLQRNNNSPVNGFGSNGFSSKESGIQLQQPGHGCEKEKSLVSSHTQKDNTDGDTGVDSVSGQAKQPGVIPTATKQLFPAKLLQDADITSFEKTDGERVRFGSSAMTSPTSMEQKSLDQDQGFTPRAYVWGLKPAADASLDLGSQEDKVSHVGNGGLGALAQNKDMQIVPSGHITTSSNSSRKQLSPENKTGRWTQRIKQRWRDRPGSLGKKGKGQDGKKEQGTKISPQNQLLAADTGINTSNKEEERTIFSPDSSDPSKITHTDTKDSSNEGHLRSFSDFEFGLGSFSLLEEIVTGQEWAKFLDLNPSMPSAGQRPSEELKMPQNPPDIGHSPLVFNQQCRVVSFGGSEASPNSNFSLAQISPVAFPTDSMDVSEGKQQQYVQVQAQQQEPMEHGHSQSNMLTEESGQQQSTPPSFLKPADMLNNSALKSRIQLTRKRQHQEWRTERLSTGKISDGKEAYREMLKSSQSSHVMEQTGGSQSVAVIPLYASALPLSPSSTRPFPPALKGVLKHSQDSEPSMEIETKRRRVEEKRHVRFSEEVVTILPPPELDVDLTDSEEDSEEEEDSVIEQDCEVFEQATTEEAAPARRSALPAWILALKRKNTGRKHR